MESQLTIKQVSTILQVEISTIRFWEKEFAEYMEERSYKGQRKRFSERDLDMLNQIKELLQTEMYTIKGAKRRLELEKTLTLGMGVDQSFKNTVFFMFSSIMQELQASREEGRELSKKLFKVENEKSEIEEELYQEKNKSFMDFFKNKIQKEVRKENKANISKGMKERILIKGSKNLDQVRDNIIDNEDGRNNNIV